MITCGWSCPVTFRRRPANLTATAGNSQVALSGRAMSGATSYTVQTRGQQQRDLHGHCRQPHRAGGRQRRHPTPPISTPRRPTARLIIMLFSSVNPMAAPIPRPSASHERHHAAAINSPLVFERPVHPERQRRNARSPYHVLTSTNVSLPLAQWTPLFTNNFDANGICLDQCDDTSTCRNNSI